MIDKASPIPLYHQIKEDIVAKIRAHDYAPGEKIEGEHEFSKKYGVSQITIRRALSDLVTEGYLDRIRGKGTFVAQNRLHHKLSMLSFSEEQRLRGQRGDIRLLALTTAVIPRVADRMGLALDCLFVKIRRLRLNGDIPIGIQTSYIPESVIKAHELARLDEIKSIYVILESKGITPSRAYETFRAVTFQNDRTIKLLGAAKGEPAFSVERYTYDQDGKLFEYAESILRGDQYAVETEIERK